MDELVIEGKTYISSKRAALVTGYAKDYVGQLCREGRIEARLVGRSWYVYEPSISKHRFDSSKDERGQKEGTEEKEESDEEKYDKKQVDATWESPKYEAETVEEIESAWRQWFSSPDTSNNAEIKEAEKPHASVKELEEERTEQAVPLTILRKEPTKPLQPGIVGGKQAIKPLKSYRLSENKTARVIKAVFVGIIILCISITVLGLGIGDSISGLSTLKIGVVTYFEGITEVKIISK